MPKKTVPAAVVREDSVSSEGHRVTTLEVVMHRFVLSEFNTHRRFSRNSASSRAIPVQKIIERVVEDPAVPVEFGSNQAGMQAGEPLTGVPYYRAAGEWLAARDMAVGSATALHKAGVHKQVVNRLLEPFMWHTVIVTSTEWDNFFGQRCSRLAQPEIRVVAEAMRAALAGSTPRLVEDGGWHAPFIQPDEFFIPAERRKISAARCARVSYLTHDNRRDPSADLELYDRLVDAAPPHWSPLEHVCTPSAGVAPAGNLDGWHQLRHLVAA